MFHIHTCYKNHDSSDGTVNRLQAGLPRNRASITGRGERIFYLLQDFQIGSGTLLTSGKMGKPNLPSKIKDRGVKLTSHLHLVPRWRMRGSLPLLHTHISTFMAHTQTALRGHTAVAGLAVVLSLQCWHFNIIRGMQDWKRHLLNTNLLH